jgi:hypothetical protein
LFDTVACASYRRLDASFGASEPHDFAVRVSTVVKRAARVHRIPPRVGDVRNAPLSGRDVRNMELIWARREAKYFCKWGWTGQPAKHELICPSGDRVARCQEIVKAIQP